MTVPRGVEVSETGLKITARLSYSEWEALGSKLQAVHKSILFLLGDWLLWGEQHLGQRFSQTIDATGFRNQTLLNALWVSNAVDLSRRRETLTWSHHAEIASLEPAEQDRLLQAAIDNDWSVRELRKVVSGFKNVLAGEKDSEVIRLVSEISKRIDAKFADFTEDQRSDFVSRMQELIERLR